MKAKLHVEIEIENTTSNIATFNEVKNLIETNKAMIDFESNKVFIIDSKSERIDIANIKSFGNPSKTSESENNLVTLNKSPSINVLEGKKIVEILTDYGIEVGEIYQTNDLLDGTIDVGTNDWVHLQLGSDYILVNHWNKDRNEMHHSPIFTRSEISMITEIIPFISKALKKTSKYN